MIKQWFADWFNRKEYLCVFKHKNENDAKCTVKFLLSKIDLPSKASIVDLAYGSGRNSIILAKQGINVTEVDLSDKLISETV